MPKKNNDSNELQNHCHNENLQVKKRLNCKKLALKSLFKSKYLLDVIVEYGKIDLFSHCCMAP
jgi:hypothetical protein